MTQCETSLDVARRLIRNSERIVGRTLSSGERTEILRDVTYWNADHIAALVSVLAFERHPQKGV